MAKAIMLPADHGLQFHLDPIHQPCVPLAVLLDDWSGDPL